MNRAISYSSCSFLVIEYQIIDEQSLQSSYSHKISIQLFLISQFILVIILALLVPDSFIERGCVFDRRLNRASWIFRVAALSNDISIPQAGQIGLVAGKPRRRISKEPFSYSDNVPE